jgi:parallel beta-helix repeat protein
MRGALWVAACTAGVAVVSVVSACGGSSKSQGCVGSSSSLCTGSGRCVAFASCATESDISTAFATVEDGDTLAFSAGSYKFSNELDLGTANGVTIIGPGSGQTTLDFSGQQAAEEGLFVQSVQNVTFQGFSVLDTPGNGIKTLGVTGATFEDVSVSWTALDGTDGPYGLYPVQTTQVLIENCHVSGASDSGIYVGQSQQIVVRDN